MTSMSNNRRPVLLPTPFEDQSKWCFRNYLLRADPSEEVDVSNHNRHLRRLVQEIEDRYLSSEFEYFHTGFILGHLGHRGIHISVWHWGKWGTTHEAFNQSWYTYGRNYDLLAFLERVEPVFCEFEVPLLVAEFEFFRRIVANEARAIKIC